MPGRPGCSSATARSPCWPTHGGCVPESLGDWSAIPLPKEQDLSYARNTDPDEVRAFDYNLFAQAMFSGWVHGMVEAIRGAGSTQLINVGQDEGGVTDRVLNQFYATAGVSFTTDHTYWQDDALLWDSVAAKRPGFCPTSPAKPATSPRGTPTAAGATTS